jgi:hypothetical protein
METQMILQFIPLVPRKRHAWCWFVMALAMICLASPLGSASAGPNLSYSDLTITVSTQGTFLPQKADGLTLPPGLPGLVTV